MKTKSPLVKHLVIAYKNWIEANSGIPRICVDVTKHHLISVPMELVEDNNIILIISTAATRNMSFEDDALRFSAMFNMVPTSLVIPYECIVAVYDQISGSGTIFSPLDSGNLPDITPVDSFISTQKGNTNTMAKAEVLPAMLVLPTPVRDRSHLKLVVDNTKLKVDVPTIPPQAS